MPDYITVANDFDSYPANQAVSDLDALVKSGLNQVLRLIYFYPLWPAEVF